MKADPRVALAAVLGSLALVGGGCVGTEGEPFRIGILTDCVGVYRTLEDAELSGAQLPLIERGAELSGAQPADGLTRVDVAGRKVELVPACTETAEFTTMVEQVRRLVDRERVGVVIGGSFGVDGIGLRQVASLYPDVTFVAIPGGPREVTLRERSSNLFRVAADHAQSVAGLATYAYRDLGWRHAAILADDWDTGWGETAAFVAEFCALGGRVEQRRLPFNRPDGGDAAQVPEEADGVALLTEPIFGPQARLVRRLLARAGPDGLVLGPSVLAEPAVQRLAVGAVGAARYTPSTAWDSYLASYRSVFPGLPADFAENDFVVGFYSAVEAVLQALERVEGEVGDGGARLRSQLAHLDAELLGMPVRIDGNGQAVVSTPLVRVVKASDGALRHVELVRTIPDVDQSIGGLLADSLRPGNRDAPCRRATPPPWAR